MKKIVLFLIAVFLVTFSARCFAVEIKASWSANTEEDLAGYKVYVANSLSRSWIEAADVTGRSSTCFEILDADYKAGVIIVVTAYDTSELESDYSNEVVALAGNIEGTSGDGVVPESIIVDNEDFCIIEFYWGDRSISHINYNCGVDFTIIPEIDQQKADINGDGRINIFDQVEVTLQIGVELGM